MNSAVGIVIGLAARAEITLFDEPYLGLDAVARQIFYDRLLADYAEHPRTVLLSTHLIDEVANLLEHVIVIDQGRITVDAPAEESTGPGGHGQRPGGGRRRVHRQQGCAEPAGRRVAGDGHHRRPTGRPGQGAGARSAAGCRPGVATGIRHPDVRWPAGKDLGMSTDMMRRKTSVRGIANVARLHLVDRFSYTWLVWGVLAFTFVVNYAIFATIGPTETDGSYTGALLSIYIFMIVIGVGAAVKFLPFAFTLGVSRRTYYLGTVALVVGLCAIYSVGLTALWWLEQLTDGWGIQMHFFQVPWVLWGPWYQVLITNFVLLSLTFLTGMLFGLIYRRFALVGTLIFSGAVTLVIVAAALIVTWQQWWPRVGDFLTNVNLVQLSGLLAIVALIVGFGGYGTIRRITV